MIKLLRRLFGSKSEFLGVCKTFAITMAVALVASNTLIVNAVIPTGSMETTIMTGNRVIGNRLAYTFADPARGQVIIFPFPDDESKTFIKRIVGLPGETVEIVDGRVYINGSVTPLEEPYLLDGPGGGQRETPYGNYGPFTVPLDAYFVMGDNRNHSLDSRFWENQFVLRDKIEAKADFCYFPRPYLIQ